MPQSRTATQTATDAGASDPDEPVAASAGSQPDAAPLVEADLLVEEVSIDGMCGVY